MSPTLLSHHPVVLGGAMAAQTDSGQRVAFSAASSAAGLAAGMITKKLVSAAWSKAGGSEAPVNPADSSTRWPEAIAWTLAVGVGVGVSRLLARRGVAAAWEAAAGTPPPQFRAEAA